MAPPTTITSPKINTRGRKLELLFSISISAAKSSRSLLAGSTDCGFVSSLALGSITVGIVSHLRCGRAASREIRRQAFAPGSQPDFAYGMGRSRAGLTASLDISSMDSVYGNAVSAVTAQCEE